MKFTIRLSTENAINLTTNTTVYSELISEVREVSTYQLPTLFKLIYNGEKLNDDKLNDLSNANQEKDEEINLILMEEVKKALKKKKNKCHFKNCTSAPLRMVGDCHHCNGKFCAKHRLLEDHLCAGLQYCKEAAHEKNALKLQSERTISSKV